MYQFRDVTETSEGVSLPSEALKINGEYIEDLISGYRTLTVEGREALSPELSTYETGVRDGSTLKSKRYPARIIKITYRLAARTNEEFRDAYNNLGRILDVEEAELIFNDEQDKYFTGTPSYIGEVEPGRNIVVGEFEITCTDPFKYSVMEYEAAGTPGESSILLDYGGTYKSFPKLQAEFYKENEASEDGESATALTGNGDCGFVAFFTEDEKIIQLGDPDETQGDDEAFEPSQTLVNQQFNTDKSWGTAAKNVWKVNSGVTSSEAVVQTGNVHIGIATHETAATQEKATATILTATSKAERPYVHYTVTATVADRKASSVKVNISVGTRLDNIGSFFGKGFILKADVTIGGTKKTLTLKESNERWAGKSVHQKSFSVTLTVDTPATSIAGIKFRAYRGDNTGGSTGILAETACSNFGIPAYTIPTAETHYLCPSDFGTGSDWHGPSITRTIPADANGEVGAENFTLQYSQKMAIGNATGATNEYGAFQVLAVAGSGNSRKIVAGVNIYKGSAGKKAKLRFYVNNSVVETTEIDLSYAKSPFYDGNASIIQKTGNSVSFNIGAGTVLRSYVNDDIKALTVTEITFTMTKFGTKPSLTRNGLYWAKFVKNKCETWKDIPNKFSSNDVVEADCKTGEVYLNGAKMPALGALGNDWEGFCLRPGLNQIGTTYSNWVTDEYAPTFKVKYREVFL